MWIEVDVDHFYAHFDNHNKTRPFTSVPVPIQNQFPTRDQRIDLARICNEAEVAMNNGAEVRGPEGDTEGITEQRVNTWFTNRRKGLGTPITPSPNKGNKLLG